MNNKYDIIYADVPWPFKVWDKATGSDKSPKYKTMTIDDICALPIADLAADNAVLFFWVVWPSLFQAEKIITSWGFKYKALGFEWWKLNSGWEKAWALADHRGYKWLESLFFFGMGYYTRANSEPCLLATRGKGRPVAVHNERNFIISSIRAHSQKPVEAYEKIERLYPGTRKLELFARSRRAGWDAFGDQVEGSIILPERTREHE